MLETVFFLVLKWGGGGGFKITHSDKNNYKYI